VDGLKGACVARVGSGTVYLVEPDINPITRRFGLPLVANYPPLALVRLAGQMSDPDVQIVDLRVAGETARFLGAIRQEPPPIVAISLTFTSNGAEAVRLAAAVRRASPDAVIILGGSAASEEPDAFLHSAVDLICQRSGDIALARLVEQIRREGEPPERPAGFFHRVGDGWVAGLPADAPAMTQLKPYAWQRVPRRYWRTYFQGFRSTGIGQTSEGCPYDCSFCSVWQVHGRKVNVAALENVKHDFLSLPPGTRGFFFADDIWMQATEPQRQDLYDPLLRWLADEFLPSHSEVWMTVETRTDLFLRQEARFADWIRYGNLKRIFFGVEAVTDQALAGFSKRNTVEANSTALRRAAELGVYITAQLVVPLDADVGYFDEIVRFLKDHRPWLSVVNFTIATPLPGTELYREVLAENPELADRKTVRHPAFSLFCALAPTRLPVSEFYRQVARLYRAANRVSFRWDSAWHSLQALVRNPAAIRRLVKVPRLARELGEPETWIDAHREVQGNRLFPASPGGIEGVGAASRQALGKEPVTV
jgi:magnesium-protoporphyrin IX monomethyl ester (oxidative) cyclase